MGKFSDKFCGKSPFKMTPHFERTRTDQTARLKRDMAERRSEAKHSGRYSDREKEMLLAAAERKERNAAKKEAKGNLKAAARKRRKAAKLRERAENATGRSLERQAVSQDMASYDRINRMRRPRPNVNPAAFAKKSSFKNKAEREMYAAQKKTGKLPRQYRGL